MEGWARENSTTRAELLDDDHPLNPRPEYLLRLAASAQARRLITGIRWGLPEAMAKAVDHAIGAADWRASVSVGWDPCHVEPVGLTVEDARRGKRPA